MTQQPRESYDAGTQAPQGERAVVSPIEHHGRQGFLPIRTNTFDRVFIGVVCFIAIQLLWMRFIEAFLPLWIAVVLSVILGYIIIRWG